MTHFLVAIDGPEEAAAALDAGADWLSCRAALRAVKARAGSTPVLFQADDLAAARAALEDGADLCAVPASVLRDAPADVAARLAARMSADALESGCAMAAARGARGVFLESVADARLLGVLSIAQIADVVAAAHAAGLVCGLSGRLQTPDVARLLALQPDFLGFRSAALDRDGGMEAGRLALLRALIPRAGERPPAFEGGDVDRVFVRDYVVDLAVGAYAHERQAPQRVRFNVEADVWRRPRQDDDLVNLFSYDVIVDAIARLAAGGHVDLVETLAERVAEATLRDPHVARVRVRVEKLDVIAGAVGVEIARYRR